MQQGWLNKTVGGRTIQHIPCPNPGVPVNLSAPAVGVMHTIEGSLGSGMSVFRRHFAPTFAHDGDRIIQLVPLGMMAAALENRPGGVETNRIVRAQIETAGHSKEDPWLPEDGAADVLADLLATLHHAAEIPLTRPFSEAMPPKPWASDRFPRRHAGKWGKAAGWFGHVEVPENAHWDPGALKWNTVLRKARTFAGADAPTPSKAKAHPRVDAPPDKLPDWYWLWLQWVLGEGEFKRFGPRVEGRRPPEAPERIPAWAWTKLGEFTAARNVPH